MTDQHPLASDWALQWATDPDGLAARYTETATVTQPGTSGATGATGTTGTTGPTG